MTDDFLQYNKLYLEKIGKKTTENKLWDLPSLKPFRDQTMAEIVALTSKPKVEESTNYVCARCGQKRILITYTQARSADEPGTLFLRCISCSHSWRG